MHRFTLILSVVLLLACQGSISAQNPLIDKAYSVKQSDSLIADYFRMDGKDIPSPAANIAEKFRSQFPGAVDIDWETRNNLYLVEFEIGATDYKALYDSKANLIMYKLDVLRSAIPDAVKSGIKKQYPEMRVEDAEKIVTIGGVKYKIDLERGEQEIKVYFNEQGKKLN